MNKSLYLVVHEIKNSLMVINGYIKLMDGSLEKYDKYLPKINAELNQAMSILGDFSSLGKLKINLEVMDLNMLLDELYVGLHDVLLDDDIKLNYYKNDDEVYIEGDYKRLRQVFTNIIKNAKESFIDTVDKHIDIYEVITGNEVSIEIKDNGKGIEANNLSRINDEFYTTKENGSGIGLYLVKEIIDAHNGDIKVTSSINEGTSVKIKLDLFDLV